MPTNQEYAQQAMEYTLRRLCRGNAFHFPNRFNPSIRSHIERGRRAVAADILGPVSTLQDFVGMFSGARSAEALQMVGPCEFMRRLALEAERRQCGNCAEHAAVAFCYLWRRNISNVWLLGYMQSVDDHAITVVGMSPRSDLSQPRTWGRDAYVCDAAAHRVYQAQFVMLNTRQAGTPTLLCQTVAN